MDLDEISWRDGALIAAGVVTVVTSIIHGRLLDPLIVAPLLRGSEGMRVSARALVRPLMHVSTFDWFLGGLALMATGLWIDGPGRVAIGLLVGTQLLYAAAANAWGTRGRHRGWMLMAAAIALTVVGISGS
jgi:hypothetical protein